MQFAKQARTAFRVYWRPELLQRPAQATNARATQKPVRRGLAEGECRGGFFDAPQNRLRAGALVEMRLND
jgi:hypothetical protein